MEWAWALRTFWQCTHWASVHGCVYAIWLHFPFNMNANRLSRDFSGRSRFWGSPSPFRGSSKCNFPTIFVHFTHGGQTMPRDRMNGTLGNMVQKSEGIAQWPSHFYRFLRRGLRSAVNQRSPSRSISPLRMAFRSPTHWHLIWLYLGSQPPKKNQEEIFLVLCKRLSRSSDPRWPKASKYT